MGAVDAFIAYKFIKILTTPWKETEAYKLGIIDENGKVLRKRKDLKLSTEKSAYTVFHTLCWNIKRLLERLPGGKTRLQTFAAALYLLKENTDVIDKTLFERSLIWYLEDSGYVVEDRFEPYEDQVSGTISPGTYIIEDQKIMITRTLESFTSFLGESLFRIGTLCLSEKEFIPLSEYNLTEGRNRHTNEMQDTFAGMQVFKVSQDEYINSINGRIKFQRWNKHMDMEKEENGKVKKYAHRNPGKPILIQNDRTGEMAYLIHRSS